MTGVCCSSWRSVFTSSPIDMNWFTLNKRLVSQFAIIILIMTILSNISLVRKERNASLNHVLNTFYLWIDGVGHMVKDHSNSERGNPLPSYELFPINSKGSFICTIPHTTAFVTPVAEHWLEREIAQWVHSRKDRSDDPSHHKRTLLPRSYNYHGFAGL